MIKLGIFILPNKNFKKIILNFKKEVKKGFGNQKYLNHPPHCTLCVLNVPNSSLENIKKGKKIISKFKKEFEIKKTAIFYNDPITNGNTMIFKIQKNNFLKYLQNEVLKLLKKNVLNLKKKFKNTKMNSNYKKYGYPFVYSNWQPHFTIASISKGRKQNEFLKKFKNYKKKINKQKVNRIYYFQIQKDRHKFLCTKKIV